MKVGKLLHGSILPLLFCIGSSYAESEPVQPITPAQEINLAQVELGKNCILVRSYQNPDLYPAIPATT